MKQKIINKRTGLLTLIIALSLGMVACGSHRGHHRGHDIDKIMKRSTKKLDLNLEQQSKLRLVLETGQSFKVRMRARHNEFAMPLKQNLALESLDVDQLNEHFSTFEGEFVKFRKTMLTQYADFHASLSDEQRSKIVGFLEKMEKHKRH